MCHTHYHRWKRHGDPLVGGPIIKRGSGPKYYREVALTYTEKECLAWPFGRDSYGYAVVTLNGITRRVHIFMCTEVNGGKPSPDHVVAHSCGKGHEGCVNPTHLRWATQKENISDMAVHGTKLYGSKKWNAKLTNDDIIQIMSLKGIKTTYEIADIFGVSQQHISAIQRGVYWRLVARHEV
jgi:DNA-binding CsgD family transcriptional regulator